ncbi:MAG: hypothetical protein JXR68_04050, partial [Bacteroidales bacterium]|nr:hypothetical protein [Bacteroidales bacterium]
MISKSIFFIVFFLSASKILVAQDSLITVSGTLTDQNGKPLLVYVYIFDHSGNYSKSTQTVDGFYTVDVKLGSIIKYYHYPASGGSYCYEVNIFDENIAYTNYKDKPFVRPLKPIKQKTGYASLGNATYTVKNKNKKIKIYGLPVGARDNYSTNINLGSFNPNIKFDSLLNVFVVEMTPIKSKSYGFNYSVSFCIDQANKLPELQSIFTQGTNNVNDMYSPYSFGEDVSMMSSDQIFNQYNIFQNGYNFSNTLRLDYKTGDTKYIFSFRNNFISGILPSTYKDVTNLKFNLTDLKFNKINVNFGTFLSSSWSNFSENGANYSVMMKSILTTPINYDTDNAELATNFFGAKNPYWLLKNNYDYSEFNNLGANININAELLQDLNLEFAGSYENFQEIKSTGLKPDDFGYGFFNVKKLYNNSIFSKISLIFDTDIDYSWNFVSILDFVNNYKNVKYDISSRSNIIQYPDFQRFTNEVNFKNQITIDNYLDFFMGYNMGLFNS